eukprot:s3204_g9.t1
MNGDCRTRSTLEWILKGGFHRTKLDVFQRIVDEGLRPGGDGDRGSTLLVPYERCQYVVKYKFVPPVSVYICLSAEYGARLSADGHVVVQQVIPFTSFDGVCYEDRDGSFYG